MKKKILGILLPIFMVITIIDSTNFVNSNIDNNYIRSNVVKIEK